MSILPVTENKNLEKGYGGLAAEYYNPALHPTCKNFRDASSLYIRGIIEKRNLFDNFLDIGAGRSIVAEILVELHAALADLAILDSSILMLRHSSCYAKLGAHLVAGDALKMPFQNNALGLAVACLGDPYNVPEFWCEVARCLSWDGVCIFTTPSYQWAQDFRENHRLERANHARFELENGDTVYVPSLVYPKAEQCHMIERAGLYVDECSDVPIKKLSGVISPKIAANDENFGAVTAYLVSKYPRSK